MRLLFSISLLLFATIVVAQKKPLDHAVYDSWQSIGERMISNDGKWVVYSVNPQEGDNELVIQSSDAGYKKIISRGYNAVITEDSRYAIFLIKPLFKETRDARIKKKKPDEMPKDSFAIVELGKDSVWKLPRVKNYKVPEKEAGWVAYHSEKAVEKKEAPKKQDNSDKRIADSLGRVIDSLKQVIATLPEKKKKNRDDIYNDEGVLTNDSELLTPGSNLDAEGDNAPAGSVDAGTDLVVRNLTDGKEKIFNNVLEYIFSQKGQKLIIEQAKSPKDSLSKQSVLLYDLKEGKTTILSKGGNDFKNFTFSEEGSQLAYLAERDAKPKELQKFYKLWYYTAGMDSAIMLADKNSVGMHLGMTVSEFGNINFSKSGKRLFFGTAPIQPPKDTTLVDIDLVKLDIWHYNDDYLQTAQLSRLQRDLQTNYLAVINLSDKKLTQLATVEIPTVFQTNEGDGDQFVAVTDFGKRIESQWTGNTKKDIYAINLHDGSKKLVKKDMEGFISPQMISPAGKYIMWYDSKVRHYFAWDGDSIRNITAKIKLPLYDEDHDSPSDPSPHGIMRWQENDEALFVYDRYDIWQVDPKGKMAPLLITGGQGRKTKTRYRYVSTDREERFVKPAQTVLLQTFSEAGKEDGFASYKLLSKMFPAQLSKVKASFGNPVKAKDAEKFIYTKESYEASPDLFLSNDLSSDSKLSNINPQQKDYIWGTAELYKWKAFNGKMSEGILYKPENFDPTKKYPMIMYFYETHSETLHDYIPPTPTGSRLNISFFVSRGYVVFSPDIHYTIGYPAKSAYDYVVSAAKDLLAKNKWIDGANIGIQGQSWGGIQVAQLVTMTDMFKAAWSGAPVANMTSAYGGIRWQGGINRQFQYEKTQSRIGATLWEKQNLYILNSPLFHVPKIKTPMVIMANDADGAVPWYQGIELFTAMRRLNKKVWMLNYNDEAHNLVERKNKKDIQIREQQFFDWLLKGEKPAKWITEGVPAVKKGKDWGLEIVD